jgi:hypothetical protein
MMTIPNAGPEHPDPNEPGALEAARRGNNNPGPVRDEPATDVQTASARASTVSQRFGATRYALSRRVVADQPPADRSADDDDPAEGGGSDAGE